MLTSSSGGGGGAGRLALSILRLAAFASPVACFDFFPMVVYVLIKQVDTTAFFYNL